MNLTIQSIHFDADQKLLDFIQKKVEKLASYNNRIVNGEVYLKLDKSGDNENKVTEIKLHVPGHTLFSKERSRTFEQGTDAAVESLRRQIMKTKQTR